MKIRHERKSAIYRDGSRVYLLSPPASGGTIASIADATGVHVSRRWEFHTVGQPLRVNATRANVGVDVASRAVAS